jgi:hypothetical protein
MTVMDRPPLEEIVFGWPYDENDDPPVVTEADIHDDVPEWILSEDVGGKRGKHHALSRTAALSPWDLKLGMFHQLNGWDELERYETVGFIGYSPGPVVNGKRHRLLQPSQCSPQVRFFGRCGTLFAVQRSPLDWPWPSVDRQLAVGDLWERYDA